MENEVEGVNLEKIDGRRDWNIDKIYANKDAKISPLNEFV